MKKRKVFWAKIWQFLTKMFKTLKININHLNTLPVQNMGDLRHLNPLLVQKTAHFPLFSEKEKKQSSVKKTQIFKILAKIQKVKT